MSLKPLDKLPTEPLHVNRALISVSDKTDIGPLAKALHKHDVEIVSTGGTAAAIRDLGIPVTDVSEVTGEAESLDGRVKTLHPNIHAGILARTSHQPDVDEIKEYFDVDSLAYLSIEGMLETISPEERCNYCKACFDGNYPVRKN